MSKISSRLQIVLEDIKMTHDHCDNISKQCANIKELEQNVINLRKELAYSRDALCADLAKEIRKLQKDLNVTITRLGCNVGYRAKYITCEVIPFDNKWSFSATDFGRMFSKRYPECCKLDCPITTLAKCLSEFFSNQYRSLN